MEGTASTQVDAPRPPNGRRLAMDSIFGRKRLAHKSRQPSLTGFDLNERSVPYDKLGPAPRSPVPVGTVSQGLRSGPTTSVISAPITNPTLTSNGTEFNIYQKNKADTQRAFALANEANNAARPGSPTASVSTADSSTLYNDSSFATITGTAKTPNKLRRSEASSSSGRRSPSMTDFGQFPYSGSSTGYPLNSPASAGTMRPLSSANMTPRTEGSNRGSTLIPPPGCRSRLMPRIASTRPSHTAARPGLMLCIPIGLLDLMFPRFSLFSLFLSSILFPFLCYISLVPASPIYR